MGGIGRGLAVGGVAALAFGALSPVLAVDPVPLPSPQSSLCGREPPFLSAQPLWGSHTCSCHYHLSVQERIVKVMDDYQVMDEFFYNLSTEDFNDK